jgi:hypothetical protein
MADETFKIYLPRMVHGDWPIGHKLIADKGIHDAVRNPHGAVSVVLPDGQLLGVKPDEFEEIEGLESVEDIAERTFPEEVAWLRRNKYSLVPHIDSDRTVGKTDWDRECQESGRLNRGKTW